jgi:hypothetical protein
MKLRLSDPQDALACIHIRKLQAHHLATAQSCGVEQNDREPHQCCSHRAVS